LARAGVSVSETKKIFREPKRTVEKPPIADMNIRILVAVLLLTSACYRTHKLAAPVAPAPQLPAVQVAGAPGPGLSRVVLDVADGPAVVEEVRGGSMNATGAGRVFNGSMEVASKVCVTPCIYDTSAGPHQLKFTLVDDDSRSGTGFINADQRVSVYNYKVGRDHSAAWKGFVGWPLLLAGGVMDLAALSAISRGADIGGPEVTMMAFSAGITVLGAWLIHGAVVEEQPGSGTQWYPE
jgi:hypothetical protein